jgi:hypothetical protein
MRSEDKGPCSVSRIMAFLYSAQTSKPTVTNPMGKEMEGKPAIL